MTSLVSVIIPVYQTREYLADCLDSVLNQTYKQTEIILVDDGSTDGSSKICDDYATVDSRIKVIHKENAGLSSARNAGIDSCTGEYITFVDSDDVIADVMIEEMVKIAHSENADVVKIGIIRKYDYSDNVAIKKGHVLVTGNKALHLIFKSNAQIISGCGKLFRRDVIGDIRFPLGRYYEDEHFTPRIYARAHNVVMSDSQLYFYMQRDNDSILRGKINEKKIRDSIWVSQDRIEFFHSLHSYRLERKARIDFYYKIISLLRVLETVDSGEMDTTRENLLRMKDEYIKDNSILYATIKIKEMLYKAIKGKSS